MKKIYKLLIFLASLYIIIFIFRYDIEAFFTFPGAGKDIINIKWIEKIYLEWRQWEKFSWIYLDTPETEKTIIYIHGNGWNLNIFESDIRYIANLWYDVLAFDFPGYWESIGKLREEVLSRESIEFYDYLIEEKNKKAKDISIWWYSIGTTIAVELATRRDFDKLILLAPLTSRYDMSGELFGTEMQKIFFMDNSLESDKKILNISNPTLIIHWNKDKIIPFSMWIEIFNSSASKNKYFLEIDNQWHNNILSVYWEYITWFLEEFLDKSIINYDKSNHIKINNSNLEEIKNYSPDKKYDIRSDNSLEKFLDKDISFENMRYVPDNLVRVKWEYIIDVRWDSMLREEAMKSLQKLSKDFYEEFSEKITVVSAYRSYDYQVNIQKWWCSDLECASPGHSEHQSWLAIDLWEFTSSEEFLSKENLKIYYGWLIWNAHNYGFHNTYQKGEKIDGYIREPWHWRYLWVELAAYLWDNNLTFREYVKSK